MFTIAIVGAGGVGSAAARFLASAGHAVTVFERFALDHDKGSSWGGSRIIRRTYPDPFYTSLMAVAYELWAELERDANEELFVRCGGLTFGGVQNPEMARTENSLRANGVGYDALSPADVAERFPALALGDGQYAIYQRDGGLLKASACVRAQMRLAVSSGAVLRENTPVTLSDVADFDRVLVAAGAWTASLLPELCLPLTVTRQYYAHLLPSRFPERFEVGALPVWIDADTLLYGFPHHGDLPGVKLAAHAGGEATDADAVRREADDADRNALRAYAARRLPDLSARVAFEKVCLYTNTPDENFLLGPVPNRKNVFFCSACSGHGFKFSVLMGRVLADLVTGRAPTSDVSRFFLPALPES